MGKFLNYNTTGLPFFCIDIQVGSMASILYLATNRSSISMKRCSFSQQTGLPFQEGNQMLKYDKFYKDIFIPFGASLSCPMGKAIPKDVCDG